MIYVVTGFPRSGTSMMMQALEKGCGLPAVKSPEREKMSRWDDDDYKANESGFYEPTFREYLKMQSPSAVHEFHGKLVKVIHNYMHMVALAEYRVVVMLRNPEEIRQSGNALFNNNKGIRTENYFEVIPYLIAWLQNRRDVKSTTILEYRKVVDNPEREMRKLKADGWPVDIKKACSVVDPGKCRYKIEELTVGI